LTPAEVNQLSQDDGILLMGGLLPYRARKVRYFLDPRFRGRAGRPPPDSPEQQARELPARVVSDWEGLVVAAATPAGPPGPVVPRDAGGDPEADGDAGALTSDDVAGGAAASSPEEARVGSSDAWNGYFPAKQAEVSTAEDSERAEEPTATTKDLPA